MSQDVGKLRCRIAQVPMYMKRVIEVLYMYIDTLVGGVEGRYCLVEIKLRVKKNYNVLKSRYLLNYDLELEFRLN